MKFLRLLFVLLFAVSLTVACDNGGEKTGGDGDGTEQTDTTKAEDSHDHDNHDGHDH